LRLQKYTFFEIKSRFEKICIFAFQKDFSDFVCHKTDTISL